MVQIRRDGGTCVLIRKLEVGRTQVPECRERFTRILSLTLTFAHPCPPFLLLLLCLLQAGGLAHVGSCWHRWYRYLGRVIVQGLPAQIHFWAVQDGSDGVPRRANLAEPVPWTQVNSWPLMSPLGTVARVGLSSASRAALLSFPPHGAHPQAVAWLGAVGRDQRCSVSRAHPCLPSPMGTRALSQWASRVRVCVCV